MTMRATNLLRVGHIRLNGLIDPSAERLIRLVERLDDAGVRQHVVCGSEDLARRVGLYAATDAGPVTTSAVLAYCLMPHVDVVHVHDEQAERAGLLLALTRGIPFVMTDGRRDRHPASAIRRAVLSRCMACVEIRDPIDAGEMLRLYDRAVRKWRARTTLA